MAKSSKKSSKEPVRKVVVQKQPEKKSPVVTHKQPEKKIKLEIEPMLDSEFDIEKVHAMHIKNRENRQNERKRDVKKHLQKEFDLDAKKSYALSISEDSTPVQIQHAQSVLSAGAAKYDR